MLFFLLYFLCLAANIADACIQCPCVCVTQVVSKTFLKTIRQMEWMNLQKSIRNVNIRERERVKKHQHHLFAWMLEILFAFFFLGFYLFIEFILCVIFVALIWRLIYCFSFVSLSASISHIKNIIHLFFFSYPPI